MILWPRRRLSNLRAGIEGELQGCLNFSRRFFARVAMGLFAFDETSEKETREKLIRLNGVSILYSTFRGILGGMTGMFQGRRLTLPTIIPDEVV